MISVKDCTQTDKEKAAVQTAQAEENETTFRRSNTEARVKELQAM